MGQDSEYVSFRDGNALKQNVHTSSHPLQVTGDRPDYEENGGHVSKQLLFPLFTEAQGGIQEFKL